MDKYEYAERYGEQVVYCTRHKMSSIDSCTACNEEEGEEVEMVKECVTCGYTSSEDEFITVEIKETGGSNPICPGCYDGYMKQIEAVKEAQSAKATALADRLNTDYLD